MLANHRPCYDVEKKHPVIKNMRNLLVLIIIAVIIDAAYAPGTQFPGTLSRRHARRDALIKGYFKAGYSNKDIALFLASVHGIKISVQ